MEQHQTTDAHRLVFWRRVGSATGLLQQCVLSAVADAWSAQMLQLAPTAPELISQISVHVLKRDAVTFSLKLAKNVRMGTWLMVTDAPTLAQ